MSDTPVHPLTLYRLTLEMDDESTFNFLRDFFKGDYTQIPTITLWQTIIKDIIGVESRIRERLRRD